MIEKFINQIEKEEAENFAKIEKIALVNQEKVLSAFRENKISSRHFNPTNGYGYDDVGRDALCRLFADIFKAEDAIVSPLITSGTHALTLALFGILRPNDTLLAATGRPYDTLEEVINGEGIGSLRDFGISYMQCEYTNEIFDYDTIEKVKPKLIIVQRSKGYAWQNALSIEKIAVFCAKIKEISPDSIIMMDNCYGEFVETKEPIEAGADIVVGSMTKNPGGGLAPTGGYIAGKKQLIEQIGRRLTAPSLGMEVGSYFSSYLPFYQGIFLAPSVVSSAVKGCYLASKVFSHLGYETLPSNGLPGDIICAIKFNTEEELISFCRSVQKISPIDSHVTPYPWDMPGYSHQVIMAAGTFVQGATLELSADAPIKPPYIGYMQGGLTYQHAKLALIQILKDMNINI